MAFSFVGFAIGGAVFPEMATFYINPDNLKPDRPYSTEFPDEKYFSDEALLNRVPDFFIIASIVTFSLNLIGLLLLFNKEDSPEYLVINKEDDDKEDQSVDVHHMLTLKQAIRILDLWIVAFVFSFNKISTNIIKSNYKVK